MHDNKTSFRPRTEKKMKTEHNENTIEEIQQNEKRTK